MNKRGFAVTTMVYAAVVLLSITMLTILAVVREEYGNQREFVEDINNNLTQCLGGGGC